MRGSIVNADANTVTVEPFKQPQIVLDRTSLIQVSQGNALLYSARSSWRDVADTRLYPGESLLLKTKNGKYVKGSPATVTPDGIRLKHGLRTTAFAKSDIATVDYLRLKPATDGFNLALEEAPYALFVYPEFYYRAFRLEGKIPVRLYDASLPEDDKVIGIKACPSN